MANINSHSSFEINYLLLHSRNHSILRSVLINLYYGSRFFTEIFRVIRVLLKLSPKLRLKDEKRQQKDWHVCNRSANKCTTSPIRTIQLKRSAKEDTVR